MATSGERLSFPWLDVATAAVLDRLSFIRRDVVWWLLKILLCIPLRLFFHVQSKGKKPFPPAGRAAFVVGNHANILDPVIISSFIKRPICYVVADHSGGTGIARGFLKWIKIIPKTKNMPDSETIRMLLKAVKQGQIIGIAPEGGRNWDGITLSLNETIPRLVKKLKLPVICIKQRGAYLSWPRWSNWPRRGRIMLEFSYLFEEPDNIPEDEGAIAQMIEEKLAYNELEDPRITRHSFSRRKVAEHLELRLWLCPHCGEFFTLKSEDSHLYCKSCKAVWEFEGNGRFSLKKLGNRVSAQTRDFKRYLDWVQYNDARTLSLLLQRKQKGKEYLISIPARMWSVNEDMRRGMYFRFGGKGTVKLTRDFRMVFTRAYDKKVLLDVALTDVKGAHVIWNHKLEFFLSGIAYRFTFYGQSAYFWHFLSAELNKRAS